MHVSGTWWNTPPRVSKAYCLEIETLSVAFKIIQYEWGTCDITSTFSNSGTTSSTARRSFQTSLGSRPRQGFLITCRLSSGSGLVTRSTHAKYPRRFAHSPQHPQRRSRRFFRQQRHGIRTDSKLVFVPVPWYCCCCRPSHRRWQRGLGHMNDLMPLQHESS